MDPITRSLIKSIRSGEYFQDARKWYNTKYLLPFVERSHLIIVFIIAIIMGSVSFLTANSVFPTHVNLPMPIKVSDNLNYFSKLTKLDNSIPPRIAFAEFLIKSYVLTREAYQYQPTFFKKQATRIDKASSRKVFREYRQEMDLNNPTSRVVTLGKYNRRSVIIKDISTDVDPKGDLDTPQKAAVVFQTTTIGRNGEKNIENWGATITFTLSNIDTALKTREISFTVTSYKIRKL